VDKCDVGNYFALFLVRQIAWSEAFEEIRIQILKRVLGEEQPGKGLGVRWEGNSIYNAIYSAGVMNTKFIPLLFGVGDGTRTILCLSASRWNSRRTL